PYERGRDGAGAAAAAQGGRGEGRRHGGEARQEDGGGGPSHRTIPRAQRARRQGPGAGRRSGEDGGGVVASPVASPRRSQVGCTLDDFRPLKMNLLTLSGTVPR